MKSKTMNVISPFEHMLISAGGRTPRELEESALRMMERDTIRQACGVIAGWLAGAAEWFERRAHRLQEG